jgi:hypothetical protein
MVRTRTSEDPILDIPEGSVGRVHGRVPHNNAPPPPPHLPVSLEQLLATQNNLMRRLVENEERRGAELQQSRHQEKDSLYSDFLATHPSVFADAIDPMEADIWLCTMESKFRLLHCTEYQKDSICNAATKRLSWSLVGYLHCRPTCWSSHPMA